MVYRSKGLGLGGRVDQFDKLVQPSKFAKISINLELTLLQNKSRLLTNTVTSLCVVE